MIDTETVDYFLVFFFVEEDLIFLKLKAVKRGVFSGDDEPFILCRGPLK